MVTAMAKNDYLSRIKAEKQAAFDVGKEIGMQQMWDYVQIALRTHEVCGPVIFGRKQIKALYAMLTQLADDYKIAFELTDETDYKQEEMDAKLREIWGDELQGFYERYPYLKKFDYVTGKWR